MSEEPTREQLRAIPLDTLRAFVLAESERSSLRDVAEQAGVGRTTLRNFICAETTPHPRIRRLLALWYVREAGAARALDACEALLSALPVDRRTAAATDLYAFVRELHRTYGGGDE
jgi:hypothetical protein